MDEYKELYINLEKDYEKYQVNVENQLQKMNEKNIKLEKDIDVLTNIIQISQYINSYIRNKNFVNMINDMIIGVLGVKHSNIYVKDSYGNLINETKNTKICRIEPVKEEEKCIKEGKEYLLNKSEYIKICPICKSKIKSSMGIPIKIRDKFIGYIIVDHTVNLTEENKIFLRSISTQVAIGLENSLLYRELSNIARKDPLIGIYNRKFFFKIVEEKLKNNKIDEFAIIMLDLDDFKNSNDTFGHQFGDEVLKTVGNIIISNVLEESIFARYGGEELIIFVSKYNTKEEVYKSIESIREKIQSTDIILENINSRITASIGLAFSDSENKSLYEVINKSDSNLYEAKRSGKNKIVWK